MYKLKSSKSVYKSQCMEVCEDSVTDEERGTVGMFNRIKVDDAATIVPIFKHGSLLIIENYRHAVSTNLLELPGGLIRENAKGGELEQEQQKHLIQQKESC